MKNTYGAQLCKLCKMWAPHVGALWAITGESIHGFRMGNTNSVYFYLMFLLDMVSPG